MSGNDSRKQAEVAHSEQRRAIVRGHEYRTDAPADERVATFITDEEAYRHHFSNMKFYSVTATSTAYRDARLDARLRDAVALDYCCGNGEVGIAMAKRGAKQVVGIDLSPTAVENARRLAQLDGVGDRCRFEVMDAEATSFPDDHFDVVHEYGALHHLELRSAFRELARILKPDGVLVCTEALRHNPLIHLYRRRTPHLRTAWEVDHILGVPEILSGGEFFDSVEVEYFHLAGLLAVPFRRTPLFGALLGALNGLDRVLLRIPGVQRLSWIAVVVCSKPRKGR